MSADKTVTLAARLVHSKKKEVVGTVESTLSFLEESDEEQIETKTLDDVISEFVQKIAEACKEKNVAIFDTEKVYDELAVGFALSSRLANGKSPRMTIDIPVIDVKEKQGERNT